MLGGGASLVDKPQWLMYRVSSELACVISVHWRCHRREFGAGEGDTGRHKNFNVGTYRQPIKRNTRIWIYLKFL